MAIRYVTNETTAPVQIGDLGIEIQPGEKINLAATYGLEELAQSTDLFYLITNETLTLDLDDGKGTLPVHEAIDTIRRIELKPIKDEDGKWRVRSDSRPLKPDGKPYETVFSMAGDSETEIGGGKTIFWDASTDADLVEAPTGYKRKRIILSYLDPIYLKDGAIYYFNALVGSYADLWIVCPAGQYYYDNNYQLKLAQEDTKIRRFLMHHFFAGTNNLGDEMNSEAAAETPIPPNYEIWVEITLPASDNQSYGWGELEMYRERSVIL